MLAFTAALPLGAPRLLRNHGAIAPRLRLPPPAASRSTLPAMTTTTPTPPTRPAQVVLTPQIPRVYVYDHCPFACRVRYTLGMKRVKHNVVWLLNDDVATPTALVGKKVVPIFEPEGAGGPAVMESMDICAAVDADARYGPPGMFRPASGRTDIAAWVKENAELVRRLTRPRVVGAPLPEFAFADAREAFARNHPLPEPTTGYAENLADSGRLLAVLQPAVEKLGEAICCKEYCTEGGLSFDDVDLFPRLRTLTLLKGLVMPPKMREYLDYHSEMSEVGLYDIFAT